MLRKKSRKLTMLAAPLLASAVGCNFQLSSERILESRPLASGQTQQPASVVSPAGAQAPTENPSKSPPQNSGSQTPVVIQPTTPPTIPAPIDLETGPSNSDSGSSTFRLATELLSKGSLKYTGANAPARGEYAYDEFSAAPVSAPGPQPGAFSYPQIATEAALPSGQTYSAAPSFKIDDIRVVENRDSAVVYVPEVSGAQDFRVYAVTPNTRVSLNASGGETVSGADTTIYCAGLRQFNQCAKEFEDRPAAPAGTSQIFGRIPCRTTGYRDTKTDRVVARQIEIGNLKGPVTLVVEAIDKQCPFTGVMTSKAMELAVAEMHSGNIVVDGRVTSVPMFDNKFQTYTEDQIRSHYGALIVNGQAPAAPPTDRTKSPLFNTSKRAEPVTPKVLRRIAISVTPRGTSQPPAGFTSQTFEDFSQDEEVLFKQNLTPVDAPQNVRLYQSSKWNFYGQGTPYQDFFIRNGQAHLAVGDSGVVAASYMVPKGKAAAMPPASDPTKYLHVTFETQLDSTVRRYWWFGMCGPEQAGQTFTSSGANAGALTHPYVFWQFPEMKGEGFPISTGGWNCLHLVQQIPYEPEKPAYDAIHRKDFVRPEAQIKIVLNRSFRGGLKSNTSALYGVTPARGSDAWTRQVKGSLGSLLDDQIFVSQKTKVDLFVKRDRLVLYLNGQQRMCVNFASQALTMAEAGLAFGHLFYHSGAEFTDMWDRADWSRNAQRHFLQNVPYLENRTYDNVGWRESIALPSTFSGAECVDGVVN